MISSDIGHGYRPFSRNGYTNCVGIALTAGVPETNQPLGIIICISFSMVQGNYNNLSPLMVTKFVVAVSI